MSRPSHPPDTPLPAGARPRRSSASSMCATRLDAGEPETIQPAPVATDHSEHPPWLGVLVAVLSIDNTATDVGQLELPLEDRSFPCVPRRASNGASVPTERGLAECAGSGRPWLLVCWRIMTPAAALLNATDVARPVPQPVIPPGLQPGGRTRGIAAAAALVRGSGRNIGLAISSA